MTLVLSLDALRALEDPSHVLGDAVQWAETVTVAADQPHAVLAYTREHDVPTEYFAGSRGLGVRGTMTALKQSTATDRYVMVGAGETDRSIADELDWEYLSVEAAAEKAGWTLRTSEGQDEGGEPAEGPLARLRQWVASRVETSR